MVLRGELAVLLLDLVLRRRRRNAKDRVVVLRLGHIDQYVLSRSTASRQRAPAEELAVEQVADLEDARRRRGRPRARAPAPSPPPRAASDRTSGSSGRSSRDPALASDLRSFFSTISTPCTTVLASTVAGSTWAKRARSSSASRRCLTRSAWRATESARRARAPSACDSCRTRRQGADSVSCCSASRRSSVRHRARSDDGSLVATRAVHRRSAIGLGRGARGPAIRSACRSNSLVRRDAIHVC